jgi:hypothetical protein
MFGSRSNRRIVSFGIRLPLNVHRKDAEDAKKSFFVCREISADKRLFMENRYLPILHKEFFLDVLCASNESIN